MKSLLLSSPQVRAAPKFLALLLNAYDGTTCLTTCLSDCFKSDKWHRIVVAINCAGDGSDEKNKGTMQTYLNGTPMAKISRKELSTRSRFSLKDKHLYLFSSGKANLMNAQVCARECVCVVFSLG